MFYRTQLDAKTANAQAVARFDFSPYLAVGESLIAKDTSANVYSGQDPSPEDVLVGGSTLEGRVVEQPLTGGVAGVTYELGCIVLTSKGHQLQLSGYLSVLPEVV